MIEGEGKMGNRGRGGDRHNRKREREWGERERGGGERVRERGKREGRAPDLIRWCHQADSEGTHQSKVLFSAQIISHILGNGHHT